MAFHKSKTAHPWEKSKDELTQFDWLTAVGLSGHHRNSPTEIRCAQELARFASGKTMIAWPTVETLAEYIGVHRVNASKAIKNLKASGALLVVRISQLPDNYRQPIKRKGRGNSYCLNMRWAHETLSVKPYLHAKEPDGLKRARLDRVPNVTDTTTLPSKTDVTRPVTTNVTTPATLECNGHRYTKIETEIDRNRSAAGKKESLLSVLHENPTSRQVDNVVRSAMRGLHAFRENGALQQ